MTPFTLYIILGVSVVVWSLACMSLYKATRGAAWLAGSTVASCLFFLGVTVAASLLVPGTFFLAPLWLGILVLTLLHLAAARRAAPSLPWSQAERPWQAPTASSSQAGEHRDAYI